MVYSRGYLQGRLNETSKNELEGWHNKLNKKGMGVGQHFYELAHILYLESEFVDVEEAFLKQNKTTRTKSLENKLIQAKLFRL